MSNLMLHAGAVPQTYEGLKAMNSEHVRPLTPTHKPLAHYRVADSIRESLRRFTDYSVVAEEYGVSGKRGTECFGAMSLRKDGDNRNDYEMFYGWRHSNDMRFSLRCGLGDKFFICDNMAFHIESEIAGAKHTENIHSTFSWRLDEMNRNLLAKGDSLHERNDRYRGITIGRKTSDHLIMESVRQRALPKTKAIVVDSEFRKPSYNYGMGGHTLLDLKHAFTHVAKGSFYGDQIKRSQIMHKVFDNYIGA
tara:strand:+ start:2323 stop:3072 length:750 start_codon:yes stop_codon:yes gene_type:complete